MAQQNIMSKLSLLFSADGRVIKTGDLAPKTTAGYNLTQLFASSEGTLGITTQATLRILPMPEYEAFAKASFPDVETAGKAVEKIFTFGLELATCEILDSVCLDVARNALRMDIPKDVNCQLFMGLDGNKGAVKEQIEKVDEICRSVGGIENIWSDNPVEKAKLIAARRRFGIRHEPPSTRLWLVPLVEDFGVPISRIPETISQIQKTGAKYGFPIATFGHIGDGNLHATFIDESNRAGALEKSKRDRPGIH